MAPPRADSIPRNALVAQQQGVAWQQGAAAKRHRAASNPHGASVGQQLGVAGQQVLEKVLEKAPAKVLAPSLIRLLAIHDRIA